MRKIDDTFLCNHINSIRDFIERLNDKEFSDIFLGIRENTLDLYYKGYLLLNLDLKDDDFVINLRNKFKGKNDYIRNDEIDNIINNMPLYRGEDKKTYIERVNNKEKDLVIKEKNNHNYINLSDFHNFSRKEAFSYLLRNLKDVLDKKFPIDKEGERQIQNKYVCEYNYKKNKQLYIVDMEFVNGKEIIKEIENLHGRYDMLALQHKEDGFYHVVFIELKSKKAALKNDSGINSHIDDMDEFLYNYNLDNSLLKEYIKSNIENIINQKNTLKLLDFDISKIKYEEPEFWLLFDMVDGTSINNKEELETIIGEAIHEMPKSNIVPKIVKGKDGRLINE